MPYCVHCGQSYSRPASYCSKCGLSISQSPDSFASDSTDASTRALASERSYWHLRRKRMAAREANNSLQMFAGWIMAIAFVQGLSIMTGPATLKLLEGWPILLLVGGILFSAGIKLTWDLRYGYSAMRSIIEMLVIGLICYGVIIGIFWYFGDMMHSGKPLFNFSVHTTPVPKP